MPDSLEPSELSEGTHRPALHLEAEPLTQLMFQQTRVYVFEIGPVVHVEVHDCPGPENGDDGLAEPARIAQFEIDIRPSMTQVGHNQAGISHKGKNSVRYAIVAVAVLDAHGTKAYGGGRTVDGFEHRVHVRIERAHDK